MRRCCAAVLLVGLLATLVASPSAHAQSPEDRKAAVALGDAALKLFDQGQWAEAYQRFEQADQLVHAPPLVLYMARSKRNMGQLVEARKLYDQVVEEKLAADAPQQFRDAQKTAAEERDPLDARIPSVQIQVEGAPIHAVRVTVDGVELAPAALQAPVPLNPGSHDFEATAEGHPSAQQSVELPAKKGVHTLVLVLGGESRTTVPAPPADTAAPESQGPWWPAAVAFGVGAVGLGIGAITGGMAMGKVDDIKSRCVDNHCPPSDQEQGEEAETLAAVSTAGFVIGGVAAAAGIVLILWRPGGSSEPADASAQLRVGPGSVLLSGVF